MKSGVNCYMTKGTAEALGVQGHRVKIIKSNGYFSVGKFNVYAFTTIHDAAEPVGFYIANTKSHKRLVFITDSMYCPHKFYRIDYLMVEANYVKSVLDNNVEKGYLDSQLRNRIVKNHMSLETCLNFLNTVDKKYLKEIYVMHLSDSNSDEKYIKNEIQKATGVPVNIC